MDLFSTVREHNLHLPDSMKIKIIGVNPPIYWEGIHTWKDYELFQNSIKSRDYAMYLEILTAMQGFGRGKKGFFLTNTRHAYKHINNQNGKLYWNTTTFFTQWNPGKTYSVRIHNATLSISSVKAATTGRKSTDGLDQTVYKWIKMDNGRWDSAFAANDNRPVAVPFKQTAFGQTPYVGNHMLNVAAGTTMYDAYDALVFLAPLSDLHFSASMNFFYTPEFKPELERRLRLLKGESFDAPGFDAFYNETQKYKPVTKNNYLDN